MKEARRLAGLPNGVHVGTFRSVVQGRSRGVHAESVELMRTKNLRRSIGLSVLITLAVMPASACDDGTQARDDAKLALEQRREQLVIQYVSVQNQIRALQGQALDDSIVIELQARFYEVMRIKMIELEPQAEAWLDRATEVGAELERLTGPLLLSPGEDPPPAEERTAIGRDLAQLEKAMRPVQSEALEYPEVAGAFAELQDSVAATIVRLDPDAALTLEQMQVIDDEIRKLDRQLAELE